MRGEPTFDETTTKPNNTAVNLYIPTDFNLAVWKENTSAPTEVYRLTCLGPQPPTQKQFENYVFISFGLTVLTYVCKDNFPIIYSEKNNNHLDETAHHETSLENMMLRNNPLGKLFL